ncbi:hypothetical protein ARMSODRAFT_976394 [Armillaria solidipes]|uniref:Uncharacterized protein n=1 Tax=Armillaria solidipes TaxID=1076256 RepID=A0A2H3BBA6_9AGAR|nr:hypothetical protein ARMSODRAFT_976394 [Armillaria solidipes]
MPKASTTLAKPDRTEEILHIDATKRYEVKSIDLDTLRPVHMERGEKNMLVKHYNTRDIEALEQRLKQDPSSSKVHTSLEKAMKRTEGKISAITDYGDPSQKVQTSTSEPSLPGTSKGKMKEESLSQDKDKGKSPAKQHDDIVSESIKKVPSSSKPKKSPVKRNYDYNDYDYDILEENMFDGMASDHAAALCLRSTCLLIKPIIFNTPAGHRYNENLLSNCQAEVPDKTFM